MKKKLQSTIIVLLFLQVSFGQVETEPNNYFGQANVCLLDSSYALAISSAGDADIFKIELTRGAVMEISVDNIPNAGFYGLPILFDVYAQSDTGTAIYHYQHGPNPYFPNNISRPVVAPGGIYYIKIMCQGSSHSSQGFKLKVHADTVDACEYNNSFAAAFAVPLNTVFKEKILWVQFI